MRARMRGAGLLVASLVLALSSAPEVWGWGGGGGSGGGGGARPAATDDPASSAVASPLAPQMLSQLAEAKRRAAQLRAQTESLKANVGRRVAASGGKADAAYGPVQAAVAAAAPAIEANLSALLRIGNTLTSEVAR